MLHIIVTFNYRISDNFSYTELRVGVIMKDLCTKRHGLHSYSVLVIAVTTKTKEIYLSATNFFLYFIPESVVL